MIKYGTTLRFTINGGGDQNKWRGFKDLEKLINRGIKISGGWGVGTKYKRKETKIGLSSLTLLTWLNISISSILRSHLH